MAEQKKGMVTLSQETRKFPPPAELTAKAHITKEKYEEMYKRSIEDPEGFWGDIAGESVEWFKKWDKVREYDFTKGDIKWFLGGKLNVSYNCLDKHANGARKDKAAIIWQGEPKEDKVTYTYSQLRDEVCKFANVLKSKGVKKGDRVAIYLPMVPELAISMLACTRIGAIHSIVFGGFSADALRDRILDSSCSMLICADGSFRAGKVIPLKKNSDAAAEECPCLENIIVVQRTKNEVTMNPKESWWHDEMAKASTECEPEHMDSEDPLFILYTSGSTGKPKGVQHTTAGYLVYTTTTFKYIFDYHEDDIYWCTADIGWVTGHSYIVYGPLNAGATSIMFEGVPTYPEPDRFWEIVEDYKVNQFYTAPTAIRAVAKDGNKWPEKHDLSSLRVLGTVGEPINPEAWMWYYEVIGGGKCPIVDTWWQTETGGILITPLPGATTIKPGSAAKPFFGVKPAILREDGSKCDVNEGGYLVIEEAWPGMMRTLYGDHQRFMDTYLTRFPGNYMAGDGARIDEDGDYWLLGRIDDVLNVSGHRIGTAEVESALVSHDKVAEAAVVGMPHEIKGQGIYAFVTLNSGIEESDELKKELVKHVRAEIGPIAAPDKIQFAPGLPKTRSGKIMRRILQKIAADKADELGDTSTLADPTVVENLVKGKQ